MDLRWSSNHATDERALRTQTERDLDAAACAESARQEAT